MLPTQWESMQCFCNTLKYCTCRLSWHTWPTMRSWQTRSCWPSFSKEKGSRPKQLPLHWVPINCSIYQHTISWTPCTRTPQAASTRSVCTVIQVHNRSSTYRLLIVPIQMTPTRVPASLVRDWSSDNLCWSFILSDHRCEPSGNFEKRFASCYLVCYWMNSVQIAASSDVLICHKSKFSYFLTYYWINISGHSTD